MKSGNGGNSAFARSMSTSFGSIASIADVSAAFACRPFFRPENSADLLGRQPVPVVQRKRLDVLRQPLGGVGTPVSDGIRVVVVAVEKDDPLEARRGKRRRTDPRSSDMNVGMRMCTRPVNPTCG